VTKSGSVREALKELYEFLLAHNIGSANTMHSIVDKFTEAGLMDHYSLKKYLIIRVEKFVF
jgi:hypothetical protein